MPTEITLDFNVMPREIVDIDEWSPDRETIWHGGFWERNPHTQQWWLASAQPQGMDKKQTQWIDLGKHNELRHAFVCHRKRKQLHPIPEQYHKFLPLPPWLNKPPTKT